MWDVASVRSVGKPLTGHSDAVTSVAMAVSPTDGRLLLASGSEDRTFRVWDVVS